MSRKNSIPVFDHLVRRVLFHASRQRADEMVKSCAAFELAPPLAGIALTLRSGGDGPTSAHISASTIVAAASSRGSKSRVAIIAHRDDLLTLPQRTERIEDPFGEGRPILYFPDYQIEEHRETGNQKSR